MSKLELSFKVPSEMSQFELVLSKISVFKEYFIEHHVNLIYSLFTVSKTTYKFALDVLISKLYKSGINNEIVFRDNCCYSSFGDYVMAYDPCVIEFMPKLIYIWNLIFRESIVRLIVKRIEDLNEQESTLVLSFILSMFFEPLTLHNDKIKDTDNSLYSSSDVIYHVIFKDIELSEDLNLCIEFDMYRNSKFLDVKINITHKDIIVSGISFKLQDKVYPCSILDDNDDIKELFCNTI